MRLDSSLMFVANGGAAWSLVGGAGIALPSPTIIDLLGLGVGVTPAQAGQIIGNVAKFGADLGVGDGFAIPKLDVVVGTAFATVNGCTLNMALQGAADDGTGNPAAYQTFIETGALTAAQLTAGSLLARFDWPPAYPVNFRPRFVRLLGQVPAGEDFTAGTISFAGVTLVRDDQANSQAAANYKVS